MTRGREAAFPMPKLRYMNPSTTPKDEITRQEVSRQSQFNLDQSSLILDSPTSISSEDTEVIHAQSIAVKPTIPEPKWQIISPPSSVTSSTPSSTNTSASASTADNSNSTTRTSDMVANKISRKPSAPSIKTHVSQPSVEIDEADSALKAAVEISIARQISISRQQRHLLRPLQTTKGGSIKGRVSPSRSPISLNRNEKLSETKNSTPTLVHPEETFDSQLQARNRKSERIVLDG